VEAWSSKELAGQLGIETGALEGVVFEEM